MQLLKHCFQVFCASVLLYSSISPVLSADLKEENSFTEKNIVIRAKRIRNNIERNLIFDLQSRLRKISEKP